MDIVARCLAVLSGYENPLEPFSLLSSARGFSTVQVTSANQINSPSFVLTMLGKVMNPTEVKYRVMCI